MQAQDFRSEPGNWERRTGSLNSFWWLPAAFLWFLSLGALLHHLPWTIPTAYTVCSVASFAWYARDKTKAQRGEWRTPESTLHWIDLLGGWPGGLIAQRLFRHKTRKVSFQIIFWFCVVVHLMVWAWLFLNVPAEPNLPAFLEHARLSFLKFLH